MLVQALDKDAPPGCAARRSRTSSRSRAAERAVRRLREGDARRLDEGARRPTTRLQLDRGPDPEPDDPARHAGDHDQGGAERRRVQRRDDHRRQATGWYQANALINCGTAHSPLAGFPGPGRASRPPRTRGCASGGQEYPGPASGRLLVGAVVGQFFSWPAAAGAPRGSVGLAGPPAPRSTPARRSSRYAQTHLRVTHGYPEPPIVALAGDGATPAGAGKATPAPRRRGRGRRRRPPRRRRRHAATRRRTTRRSGSTSPTSPRPTAPPSSASPRGSSRRSPRAVRPEARRIARPRRRRRLRRAAPSARQPVIVISGRRRVPIAAQPLAAGRRRRSAARRTSSAARPRRSPRSTSAIRAP